MCLYFHSLPGHVLYFNVANDPLKLINGTQNIRAIIRFVTKHSHIAVPRSFYEPHRPSAAIYMLTYDPSGNREMTRTVQMWAAIQLKFIVALIFFSPYKCIYCKLFSIIINKKKMHIVLIKPIYDEDNIPSIELCIIRHNMKYPDIADLTKYEISW